VPPSALADFVARLLLLLLLLVLVLVLLVLVLGAGKGRAAMAVERRAMTRGMRAVTGTTMSAWRQPSLSAQQ
jgi:hypothetical protein